MDIEFNINEHVLIKLTDAGRKILEAQHAKLYAPAHVPYTPPKEVDGWSEWQLWDLMSTFGPCMHLGMHQVPFETTIRIEKPTE